MSDRNIEFTSVDLPVMQRIRMVDNLASKIIRMINTKVQLPDNHQVETMHYSNDTNYNDTHEKTTITKTTITMIQTKAYLSDHHQVETIIL